MDHVVRCREVAGPKAERSRAGTSPLTQVAVHCASAAATWEAADVIPAEAVPGNHWWWQALKRKATLDTHQA